jgi:hypothetical protein
MSELSPRDKDLIEGARAAFGPSDGAEDRVLAAILSKVAPPPPSTSPSPSPLQGSGPLSSHAATGVARAWLVKGLFLGLAAVGVGLAVRAVAPSPPAPAASSLASVTAPSAPPPAASSDVAPTGSAAPAAEIAPSSASSEAAVVSAVPVAAPTQRAKVTSTAPIKRDDLDALRDETAMLRDAQRALRDGNADRALALLEKHAGSHPDGVLREERLAARVQALCLAGHVDEARPVLAQLRAAAPQSPQLARLSSSCAGKK